MGAGSGTGLVVAMSGLENKALFRRAGGRERDREKRRVGVWKQRERKGIRE